MKPLLFCLLIVATLQAAAQSSSATITQVYAFAEEVLPGKRPAQLQRRKEVIHLYITTTRRLTETGLPVWIRGNYYLARAERVTATPVYRQLAGEEKQLLVPATTQWVYRLKVPAATHPAPRPNRELGALLQSNEVVIPFQKGTKQLFATLASIRQLEPLPPM